MSKAAKSKRSRTILPYTDKVLQPYTMALGQLALAWNGLHVSFSFLFCSLMGGGPSNQFFAIWHALKMDRAQRDILLAALNSNMFGAYPTTLVEDIKWICGRADALEDVRNDALHSPLLAQLQSPDIAIVRPMIGLGHVRANKLAQRDLLAEFRWCRDAAALLGVYAFDIDDCLASGFVKPYPARPAWPQRPDKSTAVRQHRVRQARQRRKPQSSGG